MFETNKTLIVVYKDELLVNQLRKMVETHYNDKQGIADTKDHYIVDGKDMAGSQERRKYQRKNLIPW